MKIQKHRKHKECLAPTLETSKTADMEKSAIPMTQKGDEAKVVGEDRLQSNFSGHFSTLICCLLTILSHKNVIIGVHLHGENCTHIVHFISHHH